MSKQVLYIYICRFANPLDWSHLKNKHKSVDGIQNLVSLLKCSIYRLEHVLEFFFTKVHIPTGFMK